MKRFARHFSLFLLLSSQFTWGQALKYCGSSEAYVKLKTAHPEIALDEAALEAYTQSFVQKAKANAGVSTAAPTVYVIPVVFHVLHNLGPENISDAQIKNEIDILNRDYNKLNADTADAVANFPKIIGKVNFQFRLAQIDPNGNYTNGIDRIQTMTTYNANDNAKLNPWPRNQYLNVWTAANLENGAAGYAYTPGSASSLPTVDGVLILASYIGQIGTGQAVTSRALTHEIGHFFNLYHPWGPTNSPGVSCGDDGVADTPITKGFTSCPAAPTDAEICTSGVVENYQNYMDYSYCSVMFTQDQVTRMTAAITSTTSQRSSLWQASNLTATGVSLDTTQTVLYSTAIGSNTNVVCAGSTVNFNNTSYKGMCTSYKWVFEGGTTANDTIASPVVTYSTPGTYSVSLTVSNGKQTVSTSQTNAVTVLPDTSSFIAPFYESFERTTLPNNNWSTATKWTSGTNWSISNSAAFDGTSSAYLNNLNNDSASIYELIGPSVNLSKVSGPKLYFRVAYAPPSGVSSSDVLRIWASTDCGATWTGHGTFSGANLASTTAQAGSWVPTSLAQWKTDSINLLSIASATDVRFKFQFTNGTRAGNGANLYLDAINISNNMQAIASGIAPVTDVLDFITLAPNPAEHTALIKLGLRSSSKVSMQLLDLLGNVVMTPLPLMTMNQGQQQVSIDRNGLAAGIYFIRTIINDRIYTQKLIFN